MVTQTERQIADSLWEVTATPTTPGATLYWYSDGNLIESTARTTRLFSVEPGDQLQVEVLDDPLTLPQPAFPGRSVLACARSTGAASYNVYRLVSAAYVFQASIQDRGQPQVQWTTPYLTNETTHYFQIRPVGSDGNEGTAVEFRIDMVRYPDPPDTSYAYVAGTDTLTVTIG